MIQISDVRPPRKPRLMTRSKRWMTPDALKVTADRLDDLASPFASLFGRTEARAHAQTYLRGLLVGPPHKSVVLIAQLLGQGRVSGLQKFLNHAPWQYGEIQKAIQETFVRMVSDEGSEAIGVIRPSGFTKKGNESVGVERQINPRTGRRENCQIGIFLIAIGGRRSALLDHRLHLPPSWCDDTLLASRRRRKVHIPDGLEYLSLAEIASKMVRDVAARRTLLLDWLTADATPGTDGSLVRELEGCGIPYVLGVSPDARIWSLAHGARGPAERMNGSPRAVRAAAEIARELPACYWKRIGSEGRSAGESIDPSVVFAAVRVWRELPTGVPVESWLLLRRSLTDLRAPLRADISNAPEKTAPGVLARVACAQDHSAGLIEDARAHLGLAHYETRLWRGWHHHMSLSL